MAGAKMDLHDWDFLDDAGFLGFHDHPGFSHVPTAEFHMNYFTCPAPESTGTIPLSPYISPIQLAPPLHLHLDQTDTLTTTPYDDADDLVLTQAVGAAETDQYPVSQVFFTKTKDNEFADIKLDSPKRDEEIVNSPSLTLGMKNGTKLELQGQKGMIREEASGGLCVRKWSFNGIGAICSFAIAAATICVVVLGSHYGHNIKHPNAPTSFTSRFTVMTRGVRRMKPCQQREEML